MAISPGNSERLTVGELAEVDRLESLIDAALSSQDWMFAPCRKYKTWAPGREIGHRQQAELRKRYGAVGWTIITGSTAWEFSATPVTYSTVLGW